MKALILVFSFLLIFFPLFGFGGLVDSAKSMDLRGSIAVYNEGFQVDALVCEYADDQTQWNTFKTISNTIPGSTPLSRAYECINQKNSRMIIMFFNWDACNCVVLYSSSVQGRKMLVNGIQDNEIALQVENNKYPLTFKKVPSSLK